MNLRPQSRSQRHARLNLIQKQKGREKTPMKKPWSDVLVVVITAATGAILEVIKILQRKGRETSCRNSR